MAQLKDSVVSGNLRVTDTILTDTLQVEVIKVKSSSSSDTMSVGTNGQVLKSNGTNAYWGSDSGITGVSFNGTNVTVTNGIAAITGAIDTSSTGQTKSGNITANKFITSGGTSSQFVKGDGTLDSNSYYQKPATGIPASDLAEGVIPAPEIFWATYGTTTCSEIDAAVAAGKAVMCARGDYVYNYAHTDATYIYLTTAYSQSIYYVRVKRADDTWSYGSGGDIEFTSRKITSLSDLITNRTSTTKYPAAKATYDAISTKSVTYSDLKDLRDNGNLIPGTSYRITDYQCTTVQADTASASHVFDIIVLADSSSTLNENALAAHHGGDTYFANSNLDAWELKYSLDNDKSKYAWADGGNAYTITANSVQSEYSDQTIDVNGTTYYAFGLTSSTFYGCTSATPAVNDTAILFFNMSGWMSFGSYSITAVTPASTGNGKGVIYYMKDEYNNECPYDFKNILYSLTSGGTPEIYTFCYFSQTGESSYEYYDLSIESKKIKGNIVKQYTKMDNKVYLNKNIFKSTALSEMTNNIYDYNCYNNTIDSSSRNTFGVWCDGNTITSYNQDGNSILGNWCRNNTIIIGMSGTPAGPKLGNYCSNNNGVSNGTVLGDNCNNNSFYNYAGEVCTNNIFGNNCSNNTFNGQVSDCVFGNSCDFNTFYRCGYITFGNGCTNNTFGNANSTGLRGNTLGNYCRNISTSRECENNHFGDGCTNITIGRGTNGCDFGEGCKYIKFGDSSSTKNYYRNIIVEPGNQYIYLNCTGTTADNSMYQNVTVALGVNNTTTYKTITDSNVGQTYKTTYQPANSQVISI